MCTVCGCGQANPRQGASERDDQDHHNRGHDHYPIRDRHHTARGDGSYGTLDFGRGLAGVHVPGLSQRRIVRIEQDILGENDRYASNNRARLAEQDVLALNLMSSPGSGKTTLLVRTVAQLAPDLPVAVIEGDQQTALDAERIRETGVPSIQVNTGKGCHLDAHMVGHALGELPDVRGGVLFIENVGNLVCPAAFDLGEGARVVMLSVTEGDDKPLKYPDVFSGADLILLTKIDLLEHVPFDIERCIAFARRVKANVEIIRVSALTGAGLDDWLAWLDARHRAAAMARIGASETRA